MKKKIAIIGLGYVGTPLVYLTASKGYDVIGIDISEESVKRIIEREKVPKQLKNKLRKINLNVSTDYSLINDSDIIIICVPTPTKEKIPDLSIMNEVIKNISNYIKKGCLIVVESTVAPRNDKKMYRRIS